MLHLRVTFLQRGSEIFFDHHLVERDTMHIILRMFLVIVAITIVVDCQGGGGHRSSRSSRSGRSRFSFAKGDLAKEE